MPDPSSQHRYPTSRRPLPSALPPPPAGGDPSANALRPPPRRLPYTAIALLVIVAILATVVGNLVGDASAAPTSVTLAVSASGDDGRSSDCCGFVGNEAVALVGTGDGKSPNVAGYRFNSLQIPATAVIDGVKFSLVKKGSQWQELSVDISFEASANAAAFSGSSVPGQRARTSNRSTVQSNQQWADGTRYTLGDSGALAAALQEVLKKPGWQPGNSVVVIAYGAPAPAWQRANFATFDGGASVAPQLTVTYHLNTPPSPSPSPKPTPSPSPTAKPSPSPTANPTPSPTAKPSPSPSARPSPSPSPTSQPSPSPSAKPSPSPTAKPSPSPTPKPSPSATPKPSPAPSPSAKPSPGPSPTTKPSPSPTAKPSPSPSAKPSPSPAPSPSVKPSPSPSPVASPSPSPSPGTDPVPVAGQPCPAWVHDRYTAAGPDGKQYPTWHPAIDPLYRCTFGHEHGDDPTGSPALGGRTIPFGYVGLSVGEVEAHPGFKVYRWDNVQHRNAPSHSGASLLIMFHQGSSNDNAFTQPFHEIHFHYVNHNDGREVHVQMLAPFGTLAIGCGANDPNMVSVRQANVPGTRQIPGPQCYGAARYPDTTGVIPGTIPYEDWITALYVGGDAQGNWRAYIDPHFSVFNPNRYCEPNPGLPAAAPCTLKRSDDRAGKGIDPASTDSWFKGVHREAYLNQVWLDNAGRSAVFWTDAHGMLVGSETPGAIRQYVASLDHRPLDNSAAFGADKEYDEDGTIHAPN